MGTVQKRVFGEGKPPRFIARVRINGKEQSKSFDRQRDAKDWIKEREGLTPVGVRSDILTVSKVLQTRIKAEGRHSTIESRKHLLHNLGALEHMRLADVTPQHVEAWKEELLRGRTWKDNKPLSSSSVSTLMAILSAIFNDAVARGQLPRNPVTFVRRGPREAHASVEPYQIIRVEDLRAMIANGTGDFPLMVEFSATTGLRAGEIAGLRVRSVDPVRRVVDVGEQADGHYGAYGWRPLKTAHARRSIPLPASTLKLAADHLDGLGYAPHEPLFRTMRGGQWSSAHIAKSWRDTALRAGVGNHSWHSLRHFYASALIQSGASVTTVQRRLGHASPVVTLSVYSHLWPGEDDRTREVFDNLI